MRVIYNNLEDVFDTLDATRKGTIELLSRLSPAQLRFASSADSWCIGEIAEHISLAQASVVKGIKRVLTETESSADRGTTSVGPISVEKFVEQLKGQKFKSPERSTPRPDATMASSLERMRSTTEELQSLRPRIEATDLSNATFPHPALGPLNAYQWLVLMITHEERHVRQMEAVMSSAGFPAG
jgi:DinB family protein